MYMCIMMMIQLKLGWIALLQKFPCGVSGSVFVSKGCTVADITSARVSGRCVRYTEWGEVLTSDSVFLCTCTGIAEVEARAVAAW